MYAFPPSLSPAAGDQVKGIKLLDEQRSSYEGRDRDVALLEKMAQGNIFEKVNNKSMVRACRARTPCAPCVCARVCVPRRCVFSCMDADVRARASLAVIFKHCYNIDAARTGNALHTM